MQSTSTQNILNSCKTNYCDQSLWSISVKTVTSQNAPNKTATTMFTNDTFSFNNSMYHTIPYGYYARIWSSDVLWRKCSAAKTTETCNAWGPFSLDRIGTISAVEGQHDWTASKQFDGRWCLNVAVKPWQNLVMQQWLASRHFTSVHHVFSHAMSNQLLLLLWLHHLWMRLSSWRSTS